jgi:hypothetical protein
MTGRIVFALDVAEKQGRIQQVGPGFSPDKVAITAVVSFVRAKARTHLFFLLRRTCREAFFDDAFHDVGEIVNFLCG